MLSPFHQYELPNAVRLSVFRGLRNAAAGETILAAFEADLASGYFALPTCNLASVLIEARRLSASHPMTEVIEMFAQNALKEDEGQDASEMAKLINEIIFRLARTNKHGPMTGSLSDDLTPEKAEIRSHE